ncbi:hypothetical protein AMS68_001427 [Peltaster fructicola]|uniref:Uncharacterized protein n=1 Tax=Peltaster fructicola TaxID=286661 RepID=A0A6H0XN41_9PEZI|nr:hypothetical protein AMS68_001427 [Peltaster fructicola]
MAYRWRPVDHLVSVVLLMLLVIPVLDHTSQPITTSAPLSALPTRRSETEQSDALELSVRDTSPVNVCFRFSGQTAIVNGTLYLYGGQVATQQGQTENTWSNDFYSLDLTKNWQTSQPALTGLPQPNGPPAVSLGYLWNSHQALYLYGGEFSWKPPVSPTAFSLWEYNLQSQSWIEHSNPQTSDGTNAPVNNGAVQRSAEGAGANVPTLGRGFYFGGHLDGYTTQGWSQSTPRLYLQSLLEFTFPGSTNNQVNALSNDRTAGTAGNYRNISQGGLQQDGGFTARADGLLVYVPGFGKQGVLIALAGGTNSTYTQMNNLDVYDIATSTWYKQSTTGTYPALRVNPCAVVAAAADGSSYNIYMFAGQKLQPAADQEQFNDMWILSVPSFTWISIDQSKQSVPYGRSGHTCNIWDAQMVMIGGYTGTDLSCESPGIYVFDLSTLQWVQQYSATSSNSTRGTNSLSQQSAQMVNGTSAGGLEGSYGYQVPAVVISAIGGSPSGGATLTTPVVTATAGPLATGSAVIYTVTGAAGPASTATATSSAETPTSNSSTGPNIGAIVAGVIAGLLFLLVCYLLFCTYIYRKQLQLYKRHVEMSQRQSAGEKLPASLGLLASNVGDSSSEKQSSKPGHSSWGGAAEYTSQKGSAGRSENGGASAANSGYGVARRSSDSDDLLDGHEPTFVGVMLNPRRSLRVINRD